MIVLESSLRNDGRIPHHKSKEVKILGKYQVELDLYIVRHGESMTNILSDNNDTSVNNLSGASLHDPVLSPKGQNQVRLVGERFADVALDAVYSSALNRAFSTAKSIVEKQGTDGAKKLYILPHLTENGTGKDYIGPTLNELRQRYENIELAEGIDPDMPLVMGSDTNDDEFNIARAEYVLNFLRKKYHNGEKVVLAAHAAFNTVFLFRALGLSINEIFDPEFLNTGVTRLIFFKEGTGPYDCDIRLCYHNDVSHLVAEYPGILTYIR